jgi:hypothetical protein
VRSVARACITNVNNHAVPFLEKLKAEGRIKKYWNAGGSDFCFEFDGHIRIDITDYHYGVLAHVLRKEALYNHLADEFKTHVVLKIVNTLQGGIVHGFGDTWIELESTEKTELVCFRVTPTEKKALEEKAKAEGKTLSAYIRERLNLT